MQTTGIIVSVGRTLILCVVHSILYVNYIMWIFTPCSCSKALWRISFSDLELIYVQSPYLNYTCIYVFKNEMRTILCMQFCVLTFFPLFYILGHERFPMSLMVVPYSCNSSPVVGHLAFAQCFLILNGTTMKYSLSHWLFILDRFPKVKLLG